MLRKGRRTKLKRVSDKFNLRLFSIRSQDSDNIESSGLVKKLLLGQVLLSNSGNLGLLPTGDSGGRCSECCGFSGFDFDENQRLALFGNDIDFARTGTVVSFQDGEAVSTEIIGSQILAGFSEQRAFI